MNTILTVGAFLLFLYFAVFVIFHIWGRYEIDPEEYDDVARYLRVYPDLSKHLLTFQNNSCITVSEKRALKKEYMARRQREHTKEELARRKGLLQQYLDEADATDTT